MTNHRRLAVRLLERPGLLDVAAHAALFMEKSRSEQPIQESLLRPVLP
jgi:hypothetical protein